MWENGLHYFRELDNWLEVSILGCTLAYLICVYADPVLAPHFAAVAVLFAWESIQLKTIWLEFWLEKLN